jgi:hypothetical protein
MNHDDQQMLHFSGPVTLVPPRFGPASAFVGKAGSAAIRTNDVWSRQLWEQHTCIEG